MQRSNRSFSKSRNKFRRGGSSDSSGDNRYSKRRSSSRNGRNKNYSFNNNRNSGKVSKFNGSGRKISFFDPSHLVQTAQPIADKPTYNATHTFVDFNLQNRLEQNILSKGYSTPTPIQDQIIPHILEGKDVIGLASTGTGKTAAFLIPLIEKCLKNEQERILILAPTRELAFQIIDELKTFTKGLSISATLCIGGASMDRQIQKLKTKPTFVIATPGRLIDLEKQRKVHFAEFTTIVLDEVDQMLDMGFIHDIRYVVEKLPEQKHSLFFSATLPHKLDDIVTSFLKDPVKIELARQETSKNVTQNVIKVGDQSKVELLHELLKKNEFEKVLVFGRTKRGLNKLQTKLAKKGVRVTAIHGNKSQNQRQRALQQFKTDRVSVLLATDVASRGLHIDNVTHVINYDLPATYEDYIHRIGRTGRANQTGVALSFID